MKGYRDNAHPAEVEIAPRPFWTSRRRGIASIFCGLALAASCASYGLFLAGGWQLLRGALLIVGFIVGAVWIGVEVETRR